MIKHVCFDLDGTLINSYKTIYKTVVKTLRHIKIDTPVDEFEFQKRMGYHFRDIFHDLKIDVEDIENFINIYKTYYFDFIEDSAFYPGTLEILDKLKSDKIFITLLTTKGQDQADKVVKHFNIDHYFSEVMGRRPGVEIKPSAEPLKVLCKNVGMDCSETLMVGDTVLDIQCGKNAGTKTCAALYGYGSHEELESNKPDYLINSISEIDEIVKDK